MDVNALLTQDAPTPTTRSYNSTSIVTTPHSELPAPTMTPKSMSPKTDCKTVHFIYCANGCFSTPKTLPINPHDATDSITSTVKNMFGLHQQDDTGVSFEDPSGMRMILRHENFVDDMTVYVRLEDNQSFMNHPYNLRQQQSPLAYSGPLVRSSAASLAYASCRSASPSVTRGRRIANGAISNHNGTARSKSLKRQSSNQEIPMAQPYPDDHFQNSYYYQQQPQQFLLDDERDLENKNRGEPRASADISLDNIVEGSRRKRPKFSSDELPLFPPPPAPRHDGSTASSVSPSRATPQLATPYTNRSFAFTHPTPPSYYGNGAANGGMQGSSNAHAQSRNYTSGIIPTPAPTIASCISDEDVALQLMRLGEAKTGSATSSTLEDNFEEDRLSSECGEYGDDGRSDTAELPELPPPAPTSPIVYPRAPSKYKSLDEILPSFDSTEPSDDEYQPEPAHKFTYQSEHVHTHAAGMMTEDEDDGDAFDDEADETYIGKEEDDDADYDEDLDDIPLKALRGRKQPVFSASTSMTTKVKPQLPHPKGVVKATKRQPTTIETKAKPKSKHSMEQNYPISPASPPASRKPSIASFTDHKSRSNTAPTTTLPTPTSLFNLQTATPIEEHHRHPHEQPEVPALKPRCQRCRKSKKGCDRQRPCQRCKDAGIPAEGCISEDEAGTRRGRLAAKTAAAAGAAKLKGKGKRKRV